MSNFKSLIEPITGLFNDFYNRAPVGSTKVAPTTLQDSKTSQYQVLVTSGLYDTSNPVSIVGDATGYSDVQLAFSTIDVPVPRRECGNIHLPYSAMDALMATNPASAPQLRATTSLMQRALTSHIIETRDLITTLAAPTAGGLNISADGAHIIAYFTAAISEIMNTTGVRPTHYYIGRDALNRFRLQNEIYDQGGISAGASVATQARLGAVNEDFVRAWFRQQLQLELVVEEWSYKNAGVAGPVVTTQSALLFIDGENDSSTLRSFVRRLGRNSEVPSDAMVSFTIGEASIPDRAPGLIVACDAYFAVKVVSEDTGRYIALTL